MYALVLRFRLRVTAGAVVRDQAGRRTRFNYACVVARDESGHLSDLATTHGRRRDAAPFRAKQERADDQSPGRPTGIALAALSLALPSSRPRTYGSARGPKLLERSACYEHRHWQGGREQGDVA